MHMKTFRARSIADAVVEIKAEMGEDAVLVSTRRLPDGGVDVTAARERGAALAPDRERAAAEPAAVRALRLSAEGSCCSAGARSGRRAMA